MEASNKVLMGHFFGEGEDGVDGFLEKVRMGTDDGWIVQNDGLYIYTLYIYIYFVLIQEDAAAAAADDDDDDDDDDEEGVSIPASGENPFPLQ